MGKLPFPLSELLGVDKSLAVAVFPSVYSITVQSFQTKTTQENPHPDYLLSAQMSVKGKERAHIRISMLAIADVDARMPSTYTMVDRLNHHSLQL